MVDTVYVIKGCDKTEQTFDPREILKLRDQCGKQGVIEVHRGGRLLSTTGWPSAGIQFEGYHSGKGT